MPRSSPFRDDSDVPVSAPTASSVNNRAEPVYGQTSLDCHSPLFPRFGGVAGLCDEADAPANGAGARFSHCLRRVARDDYPLADCRNSEHNRV